MITPVNAIAIRPCDAGDRIVDRRADAALRRIHRGQDRRRQRRHRHRKPQPEHHKPGQHLGPEVERRGRPWTSADNRQPRSAGRAPCRAAGPCLPARVPNRRARKNDSTGIGRVAMPAWVADMPARLLQEQRHQQSAQRHRGVEEHGREVADGEVAGGEDVRGHHRVRRPALPPRERDQTGDADHQTGQNRRMGHAEALLLDERVHGAGQPHRG